MPRKKQQNRDYNIKQMRMQWASELIRNTGVFLPDLPGEGANYELQGELYILFIFWLIISLYTISYS